MKVCLTLVGVLLTAVTLHAQLPPPVPATPTDVTILVFPAASDPSTTAPIATRLTLLSKLSALCNQPPSPGVTTATNPTTAVFVDPFTVGRECRVPLPAGLPPAVGYRAYAVFGATCAFDTGPLPCPSARSAEALPPFSIALVPVAPAAPTGVGIRP